MSDLIKRLRNPPFGTETSERNLFSAAAAEIVRLTAERDAALAKLAQYEEWPTEAWIINDPKGNREVELAKFGLRPLTEFDERCGFSAIPLIARPESQP